MQYDTQMTRIEQKNSTQGMALATRTGLHENKTAIAQVQQALQKSETKNSIVKMKVKQVQNHETTVSSQGRNSPKWSKSNTISKSKSKLNNS